jgi:molybdopterin converting factor subunit 1
MELETQTDRAGATVVRVRLLLFGAARDEAETDAVELELTAPATAASARRLIFERYPTLSSRFGNSLLLAINHEYAAADRAINDGDELAVFPPVSGGADEANSTGVADFYVLTFEPIDVGAVARRVVRNECGATVTLDGYVREWTKGRRSLYLEYEGYPPMALKEMERVGQQAHEQFDISYIGIVHRLGRLEIGETSVVISVGAPHRRAAFAACEWAIKELKRTVPIWKKEFYEDGSMWVEGEGAPAADTAS